MKNFKLYGPSPMTMAELVYNNQGIREHIDAVMQFCEAAAATPEAAGKPNNKNFGNDILVDYKN